MADTKTVLITGAALRLGRAMALSLAQAGWDVAVHYHASENAAQELADMIRARGRRAYLVQADLQQPEQVEGVIGSLNKQGVMLDCLINNAAVFEKDSLSNVTTESMGRHMQINYLAPLMLIRDFARQYEGEEGNVVNLTDGLGSWSMSGTFLSYALSKQSLAQATKFLARELAPSVRINAIAPGATLEGKQEDKTTFEKLKAITPLKRTSSPDEINLTLHYILSSPSVTGQVFSLSGGMKIE